VIAKLEFDESLPSFPLLAVFVEWICNCALFILCYLLSLPHSCQNKKIYTAVISERNDNKMRTTSCKREHIYTAVISERSDDNIRTTSCKIEHICTAVISERNDNNIRTTSFKWEHVYTAVISERNDYNIRTTSLKENMYTQLSSVRGMIIISEPLPVKDNIYTQLSSVRRMITISERLPVKWDHICTAAISERNDNNIRTISYKREHIHSYHQWGKW
jgi:hypothetical protein